MYISSARGRPSPGAPDRPPSGREISGFDEMCLIRWSPPSRSPVAGSKKIVSDGECPGRWNT